MAKRKKPGRVIGKLYDKQRAAIDYYFGVSNFNKTDAMARAGYSHANANLAFWDNVAVKTEVERRHALIRERYEVTYERVVDELSRIAFSNPFDYMEPQEDGTFVIDLRKMDAEQARAIGEMTIVVSMEGDEPVKRIKLKPWSKQAALDSLMRHAGLSREKSIFEGAGDMMDRILAARRRVTPLPPTEEGDDND